MRRTSILRLALVGLMVLSGLAVFANADIGSAQIGPAADGGQVVATSQLLHPAGTSVEFYGRPTDIVLSPDGKVLYAVYNSGIVSIDTADWKVLQQSAIPEGGASMHGLAITKDGARLYVGTAQVTLWEVKTSGDGSIKWERKIQVPSPKKDPGSAT